MPAFLESPGLPFARVTLATGHSLGDVTGIPSPLAAESHTMHRG